MLLGLPISAFDTPCSRLGLCPVWNLQETHSEQLACILLRPVSDTPGIDRLLSQGCVLWLWILGNFGAGQASHIRG